MKQIFTFCSLLLSGLALSQEGTLDTSFGNSGFSVYNSGAYGRSIEIDASQRMVVGTYSTSRTFKFFRFSASNQLDTTFGTAGSTTVSLGGDDAVLYDMKIQQDGKIVAVGYWESTNSANRKDFVIVRLNADGTLDTSFNGTGIVTVAFGSNEDVAHALAIQNDGKILVAGHSFTGSFRDIAIARLNTNGTLDTTFGINGKVTTDLAGNNDEARCIAIDKDGKFAIGSFTYGAASSSIFADFGVAKYNADGSLDTSFSTDGKHVVIINPSFNDNPQAIAFQNDGKILIGGAAFMNTGARDDFAIVRLHPNGTLDTSFSSDGIFTTSIGTSDDTPSSMKLLSNGKILLAGIVWAGSFRDIGIIRVTSSGNLDTTFGTNGKVQQGYGNLSTIEDMEVLSDGRIVVCGSAGGTNIFLSRFNGTVPAYLDAKDIAADHYGISVYPNPVEDILYCNEKMEHYEIYSLSGELVKSGGNAKEIDVHDLVKGNYLLRITVRGRTVTKKMIKK